jgi:hypothetical protein
MAITITNLTLSATYSKSQLEANFADISAKFAGGIRSPDLASDAGITPAQMSASLQEIFLVLRVRAADLAGGWPAANTVVDEIPLPGSNGDMQWTLRDVSWACTDTGTGAGRFRIEQGVRGATGVWAGTTTIGAITIANAAVANDANDGKAIEGTSVAVSYAADNRSLALVSDNADAATVSAAGSYFVATMRLTRVLQSA